MAESSFPFDSNYVNGEWDRVFNSEKDRQRYAGLVGNGVYAEPSTNLQVLEKSGMQIEVNTGKAWVNGAFYLNTSKKAFTIENADAVLNRIDTIVLRFDLAERKVYLAVKKGVPGSRPQSPTLTRTSSTFELGLADINIGFGAGKITQANITDTRQNNSRCGIVTGVINQINTTGLFAQYNSAFNQWFEDIKGKLGQEPASNLQRQIDSIGQMLATGEGVNASRLNGVPAEDFRRCTIEEFTDGKQKQIVKKYEDGEMIIYQTHVVNIAITSQWGGIYQSVTDGIQPYNFRTRFVDIPQVTMTPLGSSTGHAFWITGYSLPNQDHAGKFNICRATPGNQNEWWISIVARGRWK